MASQADADALAERIRQGIARAGSCFIDRGEMEVLWPGGAVPPDDEKRLILNNFAAHYGFKVDVGPGLIIAAFQNPD